MTTLPALGRSCPVRHLKNVDLPAPFGPMRAAKLVLVEREVHPIDRPHPPEVHREPPGLEDDLSSLPHSGPPLFSPRRRDGAAGTRPRPGAIVPAAPASRPPQPHAALAGPERPPRPPGRHPAREGRDHPLRHPEHEHDEDDPSTRLLLTVDWVPRAEVR